MATMIGSHPDLDFLNLGERNKYFESLFDR
jgi:hypothetical protein